jgi:hypothetical protein
MTETINEKILARLSKMMVVTTANGATEAEASSAAEMIQDILQEYNLSMAQLEAFNPNETATVSREKLISGQDRRALYQWQRDLMGALADCNFCLHQVRKVNVPWKNGKRKMFDKATISWVNCERQNQHMLVGRQINVDTTIRTYDYLVSTMYALVKEQGYPAPTRNWVAFMEGAVSRLCHRLHERRRDAELASMEAKRAVMSNGSGTELVLSDVYGTESDQNNDFLNGFPIGTTATERRKAEEKRLQQNAKHDELVAAGMDSDKAWYLAFGYGEVRAEELAKRWKRGAGGRSQRGRGWTYGNDRVHTGAYKSGTEAGASIGLDTQVGGSNQKLIK